jgi:hypothetical protein
MRVRSNKLQRGVTSLFKDRGAAALAASAGAASAAAAEAAAAGTATIGAAANERA